MVRKFSTVSFDFRKFIDYLCDVTNLPANCASAPCALLPMHLLFCIFCCTAMFNPTLLYFIDAYHSVQVQETAVSQGQRKRKDSTRFDKWDLHMGRVYMTLQNHSLALVCCSYLPPFSPSSTGQFALSGYK